MESPDGPGDQVRMNLSYRGRSLAVTVSTPCLISWLTGDVKASTHMDGNRVTRPVDYRTHYRNLLLHGRAKIVLLDRAKAWCYQSSP